MVNNMQPLPGPALPYCIANHLTNGERLAVIAQSPKHARIIQQEVKQFLLPQEKVISLMPPLELLPYDNHSAHSDLISQRLETLNHILSKKSDLVILTPETWITLLPPIEFISKHVIQFAVGSTISREKLTKLWQKIGYLRTSTVHSHGEFAIRGSVIDIFPQGSKKPIRLDIFDDQIESIRFFNTSDQLTTKKVKEINILPMLEFDMDANDQTLIEKRALKIGLEQIPSPLFKKKTFPGIEFYLPLLHDHLNTMDDYLREYPIWISDNLSAQINTELDLIFSHFDKNSEQRKIHPRFLWQTDHINNAPQPNLTYQNKNSEKQYIPTIQSVADIKNLITKHPTLIFTDLPSAQQEVAQALNIDIKTIPFTQSIRQGLSQQNTVAFCGGSISDHLVNTDAGFVLIHERAFKQNQKTPQNREKQTTTEDNWQDLQFLKPGDFCVHPQHGIGKFTRVCQLDHSDQEFLQIEFASQAQVYVNINIAHTLKPYFAAPGAKVTLDTLGSKNFSNRKKKAQKNIEQIAAKLLETYRSHKQAKRTPISAGDDFSEFCDQFPFTATADQEKATKAIISDAKSPHPCSRLLCADVGFGKTEIMMRSAYLYAAAAERVLVLCPTTVLANQHQITFIERFKQTAIQTACLSRTQTTKHSSQVINKFNQGQIDILIGTHKLLHQDIQSQNVGLVIIDEEHRFGVNQKNHFIKQFPNANFLHVSATPIPRSLGLAFGKMVKLSLMNTPPPKRYAVNTELHSFSKEVITSAINRELHREGQVFYVLNRIEKLEMRLTYLKEILPHVKYGIIHGQMAPQTIQNTMQAFTAGEYDVLLSTAIIESGIDIPNANTLIIERADLFGVSQLHQLRGRIGRSHHLAYAYLLVEDLQLTKSDAQLRLQSIIDNQSLGAGYRLATQDMEQRGIGEILGEKQSGHIREIGYSTYIDLLETAMRGADGGKNLPSEVKFIDEGNIPAALFSDLNERILLYQKLANTHTQIQLDEIERQLVDRCGALPPATRQLLIKYQMQLTTTKWKIKSIIEVEDWWQITYQSQQDIPTTYIPFVQTQTNVKIFGQSGIKLSKTEFPDAKAVHIFLTNHHQ